MHKVKTTDSMPIINIEDKDIVLPNYDYSDKYWPILTDIVYNEIGYEEISNPEIVQSLLKKCFVELCSILGKKISKQKKASFYIYCQKIHEDSTEIWQKQVQGGSLGGIEEDFAASRRILKIILEQSCKLNLIGTSNFFNEIQKNLDSYTQLLEELLYLGTWSYNISEYITRSQLFSSSIGVKVENNELNILTYQPYPELYKYIFYQIQKRDYDVVLSDSINGFIALLHDAYNIDYEVLISIIDKKINNPKNIFSLIQIKQVIQEINERYNYNKDFITDFYKGLTIDKNNSLKIEDCILQNQHENRHVFRPILELNIDNEIYHMIGFNKWIESLTLLSTNSFPFGLFPSEWKKYSKIKDFIIEIESTHDKLLEKPIAKLLQGKNIKYDLNLESFVQNKGNNINIKNTVGDIDIIFLEEKNKIVYVCECKHNRSRFDYNNWKRDYSNFKSKYEKQLKRKVDWVKRNLYIIENHMKIKYDFKEDLELQKYEAKGIFIINAPTVYMFNGKYRTFTISGIRELLDDNYTDIKFEFTIEDTNKKYFVEYPYFDNLEKQMS